MKKIPFPDLSTSLTLLRVGVAAMFLAHALMRIFNGTIPRFAGFMESKGLIYGTAVVWAITVFEIVGGLLMASGRFTRWLASGFIGLLLVGILLIHAKNGFWVGEHGEGGMEYSIVLIFALITIGAAETK